jgi:plastocyanin
MKKTLLLSSLIALACTLPQQRSLATIQVIQVGTGSGVSFSPASGVTVHVGDTVNFVWAAGTHTTTSTTIPTGAASWNSNINSSVTSFMYVPTVVGTYNYQCNFHVSMGMVGSFSVIAPSGINNVAGNEPITVSPNPASSSVKVHISDMNATFSLYDVAGKLISTLQPANRTNTDAYLNVGNIAAGMYMLKIQSGDNATMTKLEITR